MDLSRIDRLAERQQAQAALVELKRLREERTAACSPVEARYEEARRAVLDKRDDELRSLLQIFEAELEPISKPFDERIAALEESAAERFTDEATGEVILRAALGLPEAAG